MLRDLRFALRLLFRDRWFTAVAVIALALGIGVNATMFTLVNAVLVRGLPFHNSHELYVVEGRTADDTTGTSYLDLQDYRVDTRTFAGLAAWSPGSFNISDDRAAPEQAQGVRVTANTFALLGQRPILGRDFGPEDDRKGAEAVVLIGHQIWVTRYASDPAIVGQVVRLNGVPATIVGVMPEGMLFPSNAQVWAPFVPNADQERRNWRGLTVFGRLHATASRDAAETEISGIARRLATQYPETNKDIVGVSIQTFNERFNGGPIRTVFLVLFGAVGFVLLIVCANVANLLLSRAARRGREMAVRVAIGASRWRVVRQLLAESVLLGVLGGTAGLLVAVLGVRLFDAAVADVGKPYWIDFRIDTAVFAYVAAVCVATGVLFGLMPALQASRTSVTEVLNEGGRGNTGSRRTRWMSSALVVSELALTVMLLAGAGLMIRSFLNLYSFDLGIRTENLMTMRLQLPAARYPTPESRIAFFESLGPKLVAIPGAESVTWATGLPPQGSGSRGFEIDGRPIAAGTEWPSVTTVTVSPTYFDALGITLVKGRVFSELDGSPGAEHVVVNDRFATEHFPGEDVIGRRIRFRAGRDDTPVWRTIVGVAPSIWHNNPQDGAPNAAVYIPYRQEPASSVTLAIRSAVTPAAIMKTVAAEVQAVDRDQPVFELRTMDESLARMRWPFRVFGTLFAIFAGIALLISGVGLYAVMAYSVTQRTQEIGVRMALGADERRVSWLILRRGLVQLAIGLTLGLAGAFFVSVVMESLLVGVPPRDPVTFAAIAAILGVVAIAACLIPVRRAARLDPVAALRTE